jgi:type IV secretion system protein VirB9
MNRATQIVPLIAIAACAARTPPPRYVPAQPLKEPPRAPAVVEVPKPMPLPGQLRKVPPQHGPAAVVKPCLARSLDQASTRKNQSACTEVASVIDAANEKALQNPDRSGYFNAVMTYDFTPGALYQIYTAPLRLTAIQLQPGEKVVGKPAAGDTVRWIMGLGRAAAAGGEQQHVYVKPTRPGLDTTLVVTTDRRTYFLELHSFEDTYMAAVQWRYPQDEIAQLESAAAREDALDRTTTATSISLESINFAYAVKIAKGRPGWAPVQVFDDGRKTFIRFPRTMLNREAPALFVLSSSNETQLVNYRVKNDYYIVDRLFDRAELRVGQKDQEIVDIVRGQ